MHKRILMPLLMVLLAATASAQDKSKQLVDMVAPFVDEQTVGVGIADLSAVDFDAVRKWIAETARKLNVPGPENAPDLKDAEKWVADFRRAGGKYVFTVVNPSDVPFVPVIVPLEEGADAKAIEAMLMVGAEKSMRVARIGSALVLGSPVVLERLRQIKPVVRPELAAALGAVDGMPVRAAVIPSSDIRRVIAELMPNLPKEMGGGSTEPISKGLSWAGGGASLPPNPAMHVVIQCQDAASAKALSNLIGSVYTALQGEREFKELPNAEKLFAAITPVVNNDRLVLDVVPDKLIPILVPPVAAARERANRVKSASNLRQMGQAMFLYAGANKEKKFPPDLGTMLTNVNLNAEVFLSPSSGKSVPAAIRSAPPAEQAKWVDANSDYVYLGAGLALNTPGLPERIVAYEKPEIHHNEGMNILFGDGHVEWFADVSQVKKQIEQQSGK